MNKKNPYRHRLWWRKRIPWFLIKLGIAAKGKDCKLVNAEHLWYNIDEKTSGCYYCEVIEEGKKWKSE